MEKQAKQFILNKGLILGLILMFFPIIDLLYGSDMGLTNYLLIFGLLWMFIYSFLILKWSKEFASYYEIFPFKDAFRTLFVISALSLAVLTVGKTLLWTFSYPEKYIELNMQRELGFFEIQKSLINKAYQEGTFNDNQYEDQIKSFDESTRLISSKWEMIKSQGLGVTYFLQVLIYVLFLISIYCAILALFVRKKDTFIKTN